MLWAFGRTSTGLHQLCKLQDCMRDDPGSSKDWLQGGFKPSGSTSRPPGQQRFDPTLGRETNLRLTRGPGHAEKTQTNMEPNPPVFSPHFFAHSKCLPQKAPRHVSENPPNKNNLGRAPASNSSAAPSKAVYFSGTSIWQGGFKLPAAKIPGPSPNNATASKNGQRNW